MKQYRKQLTASSVVLLLPLLAGVLLWSRLPEQIAVHFGPGNVPNGWAGKPMTILGMPLFLLLIHLVVLTATLHDPKKSNISPKLLSLLFWLIPVIGCVTQFSIYGYALGLAVDIGLIANALVGVVFLLLGNYMTKAHQNYTVGIRLPWTLNSRENWNRTHRLASKLFMLGGLLFFVNGYFQSVWLLAVVLILCILIPTAYSFYLYKKGI